MAENDLAGSSLFDTEQSINVVSLSLSLSLFLEGEPRFSKGALVFRENTKRRVYDRSGEVVNLNLEAEV